MFPELTVEQSEEVTRAVLSLAPPHAREQAMANAL
jgi:hypothetical protein